MKTFYRYQVAIPGIYEIQCKSNNKVYIGESECMLARFGKHVGSLDQNTHDCRELQEDWNKFGKENFEFKVIHSGETYASQNARRAREKTVIQQKKSESFLLYNTDKAATFPGIFRREIEIDGKRYKTIAEAANSSDVNVSATTIRRRLNDPKYPTYKEVTRSFNGYSIDGKHSGSYNEVIETILANNRLRVFRRIQSTNSKWENCKLSE